MVRTSVPAIASQRVLAEGSLAPRTLHFASGKITRVEDGIHPDARSFGDAVIMAGMVDTHVHINEPGRTAWEGFQTATAAAAVGGVTSLVDMPLNCIPVTTSLEALDEKLAVTREGLSVDVGFWGGVVPGNATELRRMAERGALGAKAFMCHSGIDDFPKSTRDDLRVAMRALSKAKIPLLAHAEVELALKDPSGPPDDYATFLASRPRSFEDHAIAILIDLARETGCPVHVVHLSSATALPMLAAARDEGIPITVETCPHYLCLIAERVPRGDTSYKCMPPIRESANRDALWRGLIDGVIDFIVSDHSPCTPNLKRLEDGNFLDAWGGIASLQLGLPNIWSEARTRGVSIETLARWLCSRPAAFAGIADRKGTIRVGADADVVVWDPDARFVVEERELRFRNKLSPYLGKSVRGRVLSTWLRGEEIFEVARGLSEGRGEQLLYRGES